MGGVLGVGSASVALALRGYPSLRIGLLVGLGCVSIGATLFRRWRRWIPQRGRQVRSALLREKTPDRAAFGWGFQLGTGVRTLVVTPAFYAFVALAASQTRPVAAFFLCVFYGAARGATIFAFSELTLRMEGPGRADWEPGHGLEKGLRVPLAAAFGLAAVFALL